MNLVGRLTGMAYRRGLGLLMGSRWAALPPAAAAGAPMVEMSIILSDHTNPLENLERVIWGLAVSLITATALFALSQDYQRYPRCRVCGQDKKDCWGNLKRHHRRTGRP